MKWLLKFVPRTWLIRLSLWGRPLLRWYYRGNRYVDPIDGSSYRKFLPYGYQKLRQNALCPGTFSLERHRLLWLYLTRQTHTLNYHLKVLHVAPEQVFYKKFRSLNHWNYTTTDLYSPLADVKADICNLPFENNCFDLILCNHVLEHIPDDQKAMRELYRILKKGGKAILQVPLDENRSTTYEDDSIVDPKIRAQVFGQYDHVRIYGKDYYMRLSDVGFQVEIIDIFDSLTPEQCVRFCITRNEKIPVARKNT